MPQPLGTVVQPEVRVGTDRNTGKLIFGWPHCVQSLYDIFTTRFNTRVMLLNYGSDLPGLIDHPGNRQVIAGLYSALTSAILQWEPGFRVTTYRLTQADDTGTFQLDFTGTFYPRGHLGDYSVAEDASYRFIVAFTNNGIVFTTGPAPTF